MLKSDLNRVALLNGRASAAYHHDRCVAILRNGKYAEIDSINDAIEAYQCFLAIKTAPDLFYDVYDFDIEKFADVLKSKACKYFRLELENSSASIMHDQLERQYESAFWEVLTICGADKLVDPDDLLTLVDSHPSSIGEILKHPGLTERFSVQLKENHVHQCIDQR